VNTYTLKKKVATKYTKDNRTLIREELVTIATGLSWVDAKAQTRKDKKLVIIPERVAQQPIEQAQ
jgi:hypothetical protein